MLDATTRTEYETRFETLANDFTALADRTTDAKLAHVEYDFQSLTLRAARTLDSATDAGVFPVWDKLRKEFETLADTKVFPNWPLLYRKAEQRTPAEQDQRKCYLFTLAISNWLARDYTEELRSDCGSLDWKHYRPGLWSIKSDAKGGLVKATRPFVRDESEYGEADGDEADARHRLTARSKNYADVCKLLGRLARPIKVEVSADGDNTLSAPSRDRKNEKNEWLAIAMLTVRDHPDWSDAKIARLARIDRSQLSRSPIYQQAAAMARGDKNDIPAGHVTSDEIGLRDVEAVSDSDEKNVAFE